MSGEHSFSDTLVVGLLWMLARSRWNLDQRGDSPCVTDHRERPFLVAVVSREGAHFATRRISAAVSQPPRALDAMLAGDVTLYERRPKVVVTLQPEPGDGPKGPGAHMRDDGRPW